MADQAAAEGKEKTTITAESFDRSVAHGMGESFGDAFLPAMRKRVPGPEEDRIEDSRLRMEGF